MGRARPERGLLPMPNDEYFEARDRERQLEPNAAPADKRVTS